jgi:membrane protein implicated in regulation of membrane protease activity
VVDEALLVVGVLLGVLLFLVGGALPVGLALVAVSAGVRDVILLTLLRLRLLLLLLPEPLLRGLLLFVNPFAEPRRRRRLRPPPPVLMV